MGGRRLDGGGEGGGGQKLMRSVAVKLVGPKYLGGVGFEVPKRMLANDYRMSEFYIWVHRRWIVAGIRPSLSLTGIVDWYYQIERS